MNSSMPVTLTTKIIFEDTNQQSSSEKENRNSPVSIKDFPGEIYQTFQEEIIPVLYKCFQKVEKAGIVPISFYETTFVKPEPKADIILHYKKSD